VLLVLEDYAVMVSSLCHCPDITFVNATFHPSFGWVSFGLDNPRLSYPFLFFIREDLVPLRPLSGETTCNQVHFWRQQSRFGGTAAETRGLPSETKRHNCGRQSDVNGIICNDSGMLRQEKATSTAKFFCTGTLQGCNVSQKGRKKQKRGAQVNSRGDAGQASPPLAIMEGFEKIEKN
jgi:hypothetical protein